MTKGWLTQEPRTSSRVGESDRPEEPDSEHLNSAMNYPTLLPPEIQDVADNVLRDFAAGISEPVGLSLIYEWLEIDGWDDLNADLFEQMALKLGYLAHNDFSDTEAQWNLEGPEGDALTDADRIKWARQRIDYVQSGEDEYLLASLHAYRLSARNGSHAFVGCLVEVHGQAGPVCQWWGLWKSREDFYDAVGAGGQIWVIPRMGEITDEVILSMWQKNDVGTE